MAINKAKYIMTLQGPKTVKREGRSEKEDDQLNNRNVLHPVLLDICTKKQKFWKKKKDGRVDTLCM